MMPRPSLVKTRNRAPQDFWFIDDKKSNVQGARLAVLQAHHFRHASLLADEARALGFEL